MATSAAASSNINESADASGQLRDWLRANARPVTETDADFAGPDLTPLTDRLGVAKIVGFGESTRFSRQAFGLRQRAFRALVEQHGFRALAIQDSARSGERWDDYVRTGAGDPETVLADAWRPWRSAETVAVLEWIRAFNQAHPGDEVRVFGVRPPHAEPADYDAVSDYVRHAAPQLLAALESHYAPIRTAHRIDEHVQRHQGIHPGRRFVEHAEDAVALLEGVPESTARTTALTHARSILAFHRDSVAGQGSFARDERTAADRIIKWHRDTGAKIAYWDGIAHTAGLALGVGGSNAGAFRGPGSYLRALFGDDYVSVAIGFHHGDLGMAIAPDPAPGLIDATLGTVDLPAFYVDLHVDGPDSVDDWRRGAAEARTISGIYDPSKDADAKIAVTSLLDAFDVLVHIRETTPLHWLPEFAARQ
ncbi:erythromycin esterase family protein [Nocardia australiensis]|uniref:erythromycin esterase family protein n=1 Tax=Nocardia australiensis TaxID=2887191 RepID=UPI001D13E476|nr:erythromycin esterase family protein [Nocardia australiensis]